MTHPSLSIVIPCYNEHDRLAVTLRSIASYLETLTHDWELIVINDGSVDDTAEIAERAAARDPRIQLLGQRANRGKGAAVRQGLLAATKRVVVFTDADQATPIEELPKFLAPLAASADVAIGTRYHAASNIVERQPLTRRLLSRAGNGLIRTVFGLPYRDTQCGFKAFTNQAARSIASQLTVDRWGFDVELLVIARAHGLTVVEVPVRWHDGARSKLRAGRAAVSTLQDLWQIQKNVRSEIYHHARDSDQ